MHAAHVPLFLYPFLNTTSKTRPFEYLRLTSLGVIGALVKVNARFLHVQRELRAAEACHAVLDVRYEQQTPRCTCCAVLVLRQHLSAADPQTRDVCAG